MYLQTEQSHIRRPIICHHNRIYTICLLLFFHYFGRNIFVEISHTLSFRHAFLAVSGLFYSTNIRVFLWLTIVNSKRAGCWSTRGHCHGDGVTLVIIYCSRVYHLTIWCRRGTYCCSTYKNYKKDKRKYRHVLNYWDT